MIDSPQVRRLIQLAIEEDLAGGDITGELSVDAGLSASAVIVAREKLVVCGLELIPAIFSELGWSLEWKALAKDGEEAKNEQSLAKLEAKAQHLLAAERTILNFLQRLSGVATLTRQYVRKAKGLNLLDTRKTMPGYRQLDKYAALIGGAKNHRMNLSDMILVKNNHVDANKGDMRATLRRIFQNKPPYIPVEVEVRNSQELDAALEFKPEIVMLDNFSDGQIRAALKVVDKASHKPMIEVSGGVNLSRLERLRKLGVKFASCGALTTQAQNVDISMRLSINQSRKRK